MPTPTIATAALARARAALDEIEAEMARMAAFEALLAKVRSYLGDGHASAPIASGLVAEINGLIGE